MSATSHYSYQVAAAILAGETPTINDMPVRYDMYQNGPDKRLLVVNRLTEFKDQSILINDPDELVANPQAYYGDSPYLSKDFKDKMDNPDQPFATHAECHWEVGDEFLYISYFAVNPSLRGKGMSKVLLAMAMEAIRARHPGMSIVLYADPHPSVKEHGGIVTSTALANYYTSTGFFVTLDDMCKSFGYHTIGSKVIRKQSPWARKPRLARKVKKLGKTCLVSYGKSINEDAGGIYHSILNEAPHWCTQGWVSKIIS